MHQSEQGEVAIRASKNRELTTEKSLISPNPANDVLVFVGEEAVLTIYDTYVQRVQQIQAPTGAKTIDISSLRAGAYIMEIISADDSREVKRFIKRG